MRRILPLALIALAATAAAGRADGLLHWCCRTNCTVPHPPYPCKDCCPCDHRLACLTLFGPEHAEQLIAELKCQEACKRVKIVKKLGCRLHVDYCADPVVLETLIGLLQCDPCWGVRQQAAWSIMMQNARTEQSVLALYLSSLLDPHYMVRTRAAEALSILTLGYEPCYTELYKAADQLAVVLRNRGYKPGSDSCRITYTAATGGPALALSLTAKPAPAAPPKKEQEPELLPPPAGKVPETLPPPTGKDAKPPAKKTEADPPAPQPSYPAEEEESPDR